MRGGLKPVQHLPGVAWSGPHAGLPAIAIAVLAMVVGSRLFPDRKEAPS